MEQHLFHFLKRVWILSCFARKKLPPTGFPLNSSVSYSGSLAPIERTFSTAGESSGGRRNRLSDKNLEREVLLRKTRSYSGSYNVYVLFGGGGLELKLLSIN